jgi:hypothetical protein
MNILSLFAASVFAAESMLAPVPDTMLTQNKISVVSTKPDQSFNDLPNPTPTPTLSPTPSPTPIPKKAIEKPAVVSTKKGQVTIALLGDSMTDTLGPDAPALKKMLESAYPHINFIIKNYGVGGTNIEYGITRITSGYTYLGNNIPSLVSQNPDIVVVESFGYNPFSFDEGAIDKHWTSLATVVDKLRNNIPGVKIVIGATIAPNATVFGDGAPGLSFDQNAKNHKVAIIKQYLDNAVKFARSQHLPLADAYHPSLDSSGNGKLMYINQGDHIHYSDAGRTFFGQKIADAILGNHLIN